MPGSTSASSARPAPPSYRLPFVAETLKGCRSVTTHDALTDARCVAGLVNTMAEQVGATGVYRSSVSRSGTAASVQPDANPDADPDGRCSARLSCSPGR